VKAHLQTATSRSADQSLQKIFHLSRIKIIFLIPFPSKFLNPLPTADTKRLIHNSRITAKATTDNDFGNSTIRTPAGNSTYPKVAV
jgi:hypothetical protein